MASPKSHLNLFFFQALSTSPHRRAHGDVFFSGGCKEITAGLCALGSRRGSAGALGAFPRGRAARFQPLSAPGGFLLAAGFHFDQTTTSKPHSSPDLPPKATRPLQSQTGCGVRPGALGPPWGLLAGFPRAGGGSQHPRGVQRCLRTKGKKPQRIPLWATESRGLGLCKAEPLHLHPINPLLCPADTSALPSHLPGGERGLANAHSFW